jgi:hypothetical protein
MRSPAFSEGGKHHGDSLVWGIAERRYLLLLAFEEGDGVLMNAEQSIESLPERGIIGANLVQIRGALVCR